MGPWSRGVTLAAGLLGAGVAAREGVRAQQAQEKPPEITVYKSPT